MEYREVGGLDLPVSRIIFGTANSAMMDGRDASELLDFAYKLGINTFDTARRYLLAEKSLGDWIASRENRRKVQIITKGAHPYVDSTTPRVTPEAIHEDMEESLRLLQTDYVDVYLLHRDDPTKPVGPIVETLNELCDKGKIRVFGASNWTAARIEEANEYAYQKDLIPMTVTSPNYSLARQVHDPWGGGCVTISGPEHKKEREFYVNEGIEIFAYAALGHGLFSGKVTTKNLKDVTKLLDEFAIKGYCCRENYERLHRAEQIASHYDATIAQIALAWLLAQPEQAFAIVSASNKERLASNLVASGLTLTEKELKYLDLE